MTTKNKLIKYIKDGTSKSLETKCSLEKFILKKKIIQNLTKIKIQQCKNSKSTHKRHNTGITSYRRSHNEHIHHINDKKITKATYKQCTALQCQSRSEQVESSKYKV